MANFGGFGHSPRCPEKSIMALGKNRRNTKHMNETYEYALPFIYFILILKIHCIRLTVIHD